MAMFETLHNLFHIPYKLQIIDDTKTGTPVLFLHGIASDSSTWNLVLPLLPTSIRSITIDLLGFGASPKPSKSNYTVKDHAASVAKTILSLKLDGPAIVVGHSMGGLVAIELAKSYPNLVSNLFLISTPLYKQEDIVAATSKYSSSKNIVTNGLFQVYDKILGNEKMTLKTAQTIMKISPASKSFILTKNTWIPFKKSLANTIMRQTSMVDILQLSIPITLYYGKIDVLLQNKNYMELVASRKSNISIVALNSAHMVTKNSAQILVKDITARI
jgi:pimeloyl-ACP methyl ester carboxylesterase